MIKTGLADSSIDLSELNVVYNTYRQVNDPLGNFTGDYNVIKSGKTMMDVGGNGQLSTLSLARWGGVTDESVMPYEQGLFACGYDYPNEYSSEMDVAHLQNAYWLNLNSEAEAVKQFVMDGNAVGMAYWNTESGHNSTYNSFYQDTQISTNHAVAIVGWDDNFSKENFNEGKKPSVDGAWLIRNSWGSEWGDNGYFWISYADASLEYGTAYVFNFEDADNYDRNYQYDGSVGMGAFSLLDCSSLMGANVFTAQGDETLKAVSFVNPRNTNVQYTISVYINPTNSNEPSTGTLASSVTGMETYCGYHTITLPSPVALSEGDVFAVVVSLTDAQGKDLYISYESTYDYGWMKSVSASEYGQSYISYDGGFNWFDFKTTVNGNMRIKAFTDVETLEAPTGLKAAVDENSGNVVLNWNAASGAVSYEVYRKGDSDSEYVLIASPTEAQYSYTPDADSDIVMLYRVKAVNNDETSDYSKATSVMLPVSHYVIQFDMRCGNNYSNTTIQKGDSAQITVENFDSRYAEDRVVAFSCTDTNVATVDRNGVITAVGYGNATINAVSRNNYEATNSIVVHVPETINVTSLEQMQSAHPYKEGTEQIYIYKKVNATSVSIVFSGDTALDNGDDKICIYNANDVLQGTYALKQLANKTVTVQGDTFKLSLQTTALGTDYGFRATSITYTGGDLDTALLTQYINEAGTLTQSDYTAASWTALQQKISAGQVLFTNPAATQEDIDNAAQAIRNAIDTLAVVVRIQSVSITASGAQNGVLKLIVPPEQAYTTAAAQLSLSIEPANATYTSVEWSSSDFFIAVSESGYVTAAWNEAACSTITATVTDEAGDTYTAEMDVAIIHYDAQKVTLSEVSLQFTAAGEQQTLNAWVTDNNGNNAELYDVTWTTDNEAVAVVDGSGAVTAVGNGTARIRATADFGGAYDECVVTVGGHTHSYTSQVIQPTCNEQGYTEHTCSCGDSYRSDYTAATGNHTWEQTASIPATCHTYSETTFECSVCHTTKTETGTSYDGNNHSGETEVRGYTAETCGADGYTGDTYCKGCNNEISKGIAIAATGNHTAGAATEENRVEATCAVNGRYDSVVCCTVCGTEISREEKTIAATGNHTAGAATEENRVEATCAVNGRYDSVVCCTVCGTEISREEKTIAATGNHTWEQTASIPATCHTYSVTDFECFVCHTTKTETGTSYDGNNHSGETEIRNAAAPSCSAQGYTGDTYCKGCNVRLASGVNTAKTEHTAVTDAAYEATCTATGKTEGSHCSVCGEIITAQQTVPMKNHSYGTAVITQATCTAGGYAEYTCTVCGNKNRTDATAALGHTDENGDGICDRCGEDMPASPACTCDCHSDSFFTKIFWKIKVFFWKLFGIENKRQCACGEMHW